MNNSRLKKAVCALCAACNMWILTVHSVHATPHELEYSMDQILPRE